MRAIQFKAFGDPSVLELTEVAAPALGETMALVRVMAASINPSDVKNVAGAMKQTRLPRIPARDFAGVLQALENRAAEFCDSAVGVFLRIADFTGGRLVTNDFHSLNKWGGNS